MGNVYTTVVNDPDELNPLVKVLYTAAIEEIKSKGITPLTVETYRSKKRQYYLYCQGRTASVAINAGVPSSIANKYCPTLKNKSKVTWTLNSIHIERKAVDIIAQRLVKGKKTAIWDNTDSENKKIVKIMTKYGFEAGANWTSNPDSAHFQIKGKFTSTFKKGYTNSYITKMIQKALNNIEVDDKGTPLLKTKLIEDGDWGDKTTKAVNAFRKFKKYSNTSNGTLGKKALKDLIAYL